MIKRLSQSPNSLIKRDMANSIQSPATEGMALKEMGAKWMDRIRAAETREKDWLKIAGSAEAMYLSEVKDGAPKQYFNILHSNVETIVPATYNSTPSPDIRRRFNDNDPVAKAVADVLERAITVQIDDGALDSEMEGVAQSAFLTGRGVLRVRIFTDDADPLNDAVEDTAEAESQNEEGEEPGIGHNQPTAPPPQGDQRLTFEAVSWRDFRFGPAKRWRDVPWVAFRQIVTQEQIDAWEKDEAVRAQNLTNIATSGGGEDKDGDVEIWEVWCKATKEVYFLKALDGLVYNKMSDPLGLNGFFPCVRPVQPVEIVGKLQPMCPFTAYQELADELEIVTKRIKKIVAGIVVRGGAAAGETMKEISKIAELGDNEIAEIRGVEAMAQQGGLDKAITWWPIEKAIQALQALAVHRDTIKAQIYEITGISDIVRGASNAQETARAQEIKSQWGSLRIQKMQRLLERCVRDMFVISVELISTQFYPENLQRMTGIQITPEMQAVLSDKVTQFYRINVESESTIKADMTKSRGEMAQFMQGTAQFIQAVAPMAQSGQFPKEIVMEIYSAFARSFKLGKSAEDALAQLSSQAQQAQQQPPEPPPPDPAIEKAKAQAVTDQQKHEQSMTFRQQEHDQKLALDAKAHAFEMSKQGAAEGDPDQGGGYVDKQDQYTLAIMQALQQIMAAVSAPRMSQISVGPDGQKRSISQPIIPQNQQSTVN
jgi:hypothetical protein